MVTTLSKPSLFLHEITVRKTGDLSLFKFSDRLQDRMELLLDKKKADELALEEIAELEAIIGRATCDRFDLNDMGYPEGD
ncbi:hypothetical protein [Pseudanabaena sp. 'Roaring Creek']|uniref:hypothetical protein n=1 Tax=Pseudanabaena sp. 'Roaring Creek' TaxID=1681830 RepID=UPI0006D77F83|nr:hypothetical protein [Pseudanabaena sp. 'Roaring Creek']